MKAKKNKGCGLGLARESLRSLTEGALQTVHGGFPAGSPSIKTGACDPPVEVWH